MGNDIDRRGNKGQAEDQQSDKTAEANKPDRARAADKPKAGNILGGVQPK